MSESTGFREKDTRVAELLGIKLCHHELDSAKPVCKYCHLNKGFWWPKWGRIVPPKLYTISIADAWDAMEFMLALDSHGNHAAPDRFFDELRGRSLYQSRRETAMAICDAFLAAMEAT